MEKPQGIKYVFTILNWMPMLWITQNHYKSESETFISRVNPGLVYWVLCVCMRQKLVLLWAQMILSGLGKSFLLGLRLNDCGLTGTELSLLPRERTMRPRTSTPSMVMFPAALMDFSPTVLQSITTLAAVLLMATWSWWDSIVSSDLTINRPTNRPPYE